MTEASVLVEVTGCIANVTLNRPETCNAIDVAMYREICSVLDGLGRDDEVSAVILRGSGDCFSAGEDLVGMAERGGADALLEWRREYRGFVAVTWLLPKLVIAVVRGEALGVGCELALLADVTISAPSGRFGHPETKFGLLTPTVWPWLAGPKIAKEYLASGRVMAAAEAKRVRLINQVYEEAALEAEVESLAKDFASMPRGAAVANKKRLNWSYRDISRTLLDDLNYGIEFGWLADNRSVDEAFYASVRDHGFDTAIRMRNERFQKS
jgi:enoyl-CoA hydratase